MKLLILILIVTVCLIKQHLPNGQKYQTWWLPWVPNYHCKSIGGEFSIGSCTITVSLYNYSSSKIQNKNIIIMLKPRSKIFNHEAGEELPSPALWLKIFESWVGV